MTHFDVITVFPGAFKSYLEAGVLGKALEAGLYTLEVHDLRAFTEGKSHATDDYPFGGGPGMVMKPEPIIRAIRAIKAKRPETFVILLTPQGALFSQRLAWDLSRRKEIVLICGRYEGVDERVAEHFANMELSIGDYVLTGGELPAMVLIDAVARFIPGVVGDAASVKDDTHAGGLLKYPQYTRPGVFEGLAVPQVLLSGDHGRIDRWRRQEALKRTWLRRPELLDAAPLSAKDEATLERIKSEMASGVR